MRLKHSHHFLWKALTYLKHTGMLFLLFGSLKGMAVQEGESLSASSVEGSSGGELKEKVIIRRHGCVYDDSGTEVMGLGEHVNQSLKALEEKGVNCVEINQGVNDIRKTLEEFYKAQGKDLMEEKNNEMVYREFNLTCQNYEKLLHHEFTEALYYKRRLRRIPKENKFSEVCVGEDYSTRQLNGDIFYNENDLSYSKCLKDELAKRLKKWIDSCEKQGKGKSATERSKSIMERLDEGKRLTDDVKLLLDKIRSKANPRDCPGVNSHEVNKEIAKSIVSITSGIADKFLGGSGALIQLGGEMLNFAMDRLHALKLHYSTENQDRLNSVMERNVCMFNEVVKTHCEKFKLPQHEQLVRECLPDEKFITDRNVEGILQNFHQPDTYGTFANDSSYSSYLRGVIKEYNRPSLDLSPYLKAPEEDGAEENADGELRVSVGAEVKDVTAPKKAWERTRVSFGRGKSQIVEKKRGRPTEDKEVQAHSSNATKDPIGEALGESGPKGLLSPKQLIKLASEYYLAKDNDSYGHLNHAYLNFVQVESLLKEENQINKIFDKDLDHVEANRTRLNEIGGKLKSLSKEINDQNIGVLLTNFVKDVVFKNINSDSLNKIRAEEIALDIFNTYDKVMFSFDGHESKLSNLENSMIEKFKAMTKQRMTLRYKENFKNFFNTMKSYDSDAPNKEASLNSAFDSLRSIIKDCIATQGLFFMKRRPMTRTRALLIKMGIIQDPTQLNANLNVEISHNYLKMCWPFLCEEGIPLPSLPEKKKKDKDFAKYQCRILDDGFSIYKRMEEEFFRSEKICGRTVDEIKTQIKENTFKRILPKKDVKDLVEKIVASPERAARQGE